jgi:hypothetical protein
MRRELKTVALGENKVWKQKDLLAKKPKRTKINVLISVSFGFFAGNNLHLLIFNAAEIISNVKIERVIFNFGANVFDVGFKIAV